MGDVAVSIEAVTKRFRLYHENTRSLKERVIRAGRNPYEEFFALRDVTFDVIEGETFGLFGHNGSGKSTLLKCVAGTLRPTSGHIRSVGRMAALLELGAGMHPDLTGRENIYLNGSILGLSAVDIAAVFDDIVAFAELEQFVDLQLKHYSSGMAARLGFAVAIHVDPEILLVDEVLSVGDEAFQRKCVERVRLLQREGRTILVVTHAVDLIRQIGTRAAVLEHGRLLTVGDPADAIRVLRESLLRGGIALPDDVDDEQPSTAGREFVRTVRIGGVTLEAPRKRSYLRSGEPLKIAVEFEADGPHDDLVVAFAIHDDQGQMMISTNSEIVSGDVLRVPGGPGRYVYVLDNLPFGSGVYDVAIGLHTLDGIEYDHRERAATLQVSSDGRAVGRVHVAVSGGIVEPRRKPRVARAR